MSGSPKPSPLSRMNRQRRALDNEIRRLQRKEFLALPARVGLDTIDNLILSLIEYASPAIRARFSKEAQSNTTNIAPHQQLGSSSRIKFPSELRERVRKELEQGAKSVAQISREYGPSHPTIMGWKREWGMTRPRSQRQRTNGVGDT